MIADGYKAFVNKSDVASVVKEYVAIIAVRISGVGNGKLCSQLNTAISFDEAVCYGWRCQNGGNFWKIQSG